MITRIHNKIKRNHPAVSCVFVGNNLRRVSVSTDKDLISKTPQANIIGYYDGKVAEWMLMDDLDYFGVVYEADDF